VVSLVLPVHSPEVRSGVRLPCMPYSFTNYQRTTWCHMVAHDWATWHLNIQPQYTKCHMPIGPCLPCHFSVIPAMSAADVIRATCHPYSGDTCHPWIGPYACQINLPRVVTQGCHVLSPEATTCHLQELPHKPVRTVQSSPFFFCLFDFLDRTRYLAHTEPV
jgi:hypothetical protein